MIEVTLSISDCFEISDSRDQPVYLVRLKGFNLIELLKSGGFPTSANVRRPKKGLVTGKLATSVLENPKHRIDQPIFLSVRNLTQNSADKTITLFFGEYDGVIDGLHRLLGLSALIELGADISQVEILFDVSCNLSEIDVRNKAITLNTTKKVQEFSKKDFLRDYDFLKPTLEGYTIFYAEGSVPEEYAGTKTAQLCSIVRVITMVLTVDKTYDPADPTTKKNHPPHKAIGCKATTFNEKAKGYMRANLHLVPDVLKLQTMICKEWERRFKNRKPNDSLKILHVRLPVHARLTKLPTSDYLEVQISVTLLIIPIIAAFRVFLTHLYSWCTDDFMERQAQREVERLVTALIQILNHEKYCDELVESLLKDENIWNKLYIVALNSKNSMMGTKKPKPISGG